MININVDGGTAKLGDNLCKTCRHGIVIEMANGAEILRCQYIDRAMPAAVLRCNTYGNKNDTDIYSMKEIAWTITADPKGKMGFTPPDPNKKSDPFGGV